MVTASSQVTRFLISMVFSEQIPDTKQSSRSLNLVEKRQTEACSIVCYDSAHHHVLKYDLCTLGCRSILSCGSDVIRQLGGKLLMATREQRMKPMFVSSRPRQTTGPCYRDESEVFVKYLPKCPFIYFNARPIIIPGGSSEHWT